MRNKLVFPYQKYPLLKKEINSEFLMFEINILYPLCNIKDDAIFSSYLYINRHQYHFNLQGLCRSVLYLKLASHLNVEVKILSNESVRDSCHPGGVSLPQCFISCYTSFQHLILSLSPTLSGSIHLLRTVVFYWSPVYAVIATFIATVKAELQTILLNQ